MKKMKIFFLVINKIKNRFYKKKNNKKKVMKRTINFMINLIFTNRRNKINV